PVTKLLALGPAVSLPATPANLVLAPTSAANPAGTTQTVTATVTDSNSSPVVGAIVYFTISSGPNMGPAVPSITDATGRAMFTYRDAAGVGTDSVQATSGALHSNAAQVSWTSPGPLDHIAISPSIATVSPGGNQSYTAQGFDVFNSGLGDVTAATTFSIKPDG